jgi:hypothetical protein
MDEPSDEEGFELAVAIGVLILILSNLPYLIA